MNRRPGWEGDRALFAAALGLALASSLAMWSAASSVREGLAARHLTWILIGVAVSLGVARTNHRHWTDVAWLTYGLSLVLLVLVRVAGAERLGATRWLSVFGFSVQPSEVAKLTTIWLLARYLSGVPAPLSARALGISLCFVGPPALLIFTQPDLGSASVFAAIWFGMVWVAGISRRALSLLLAGGLACLPLGWYVLKGYQRDRLLVFLNPQADPLGAGYTIIQSTIAIGSGGWLGRGWFAGTQGRLSFLPERHSDFIFSVIGEEWGWLGCLGVLGLFGWLLSRILAVASLASDRQGRLLAVGVFSWLGYQAFINMSMVMGVLPVVGVPLPLISYGGSSMVAIWIALGLLHSIVRTER